ncbi:MAG: NTP transferase domain-containing protein [Oscillospiraceae bacterium]
MNLSRKEFDVLVFVEKCGLNVTTQREIAKQTDMSLGTVNKILTDLTQKEFMKDGVITKNGINVLEPYKVKRAVILAAGFGSRLVPVTLNTPKPLVRVKGVRMIDTLLDALTELGIEDITIVRGYLGEQFDQLLYKYPNIKFIENPAYNESNNISSAMCIRYLLRNAYVMEADLVLANPSILCRYHYTSNYLGVPTELTDDWCFETKDKLITKVKIGGTDCYHMFGISYWNEADGARMAEHIKAVYEMPGGKERYWDQVALEFFHDFYKIEVKPCTFEDIVEIDTYRDLKKMDSTYC